jgi:hypothetical protein
MLIILPSGALAEDRMTDVNSPKFAALSEVPDLSDLVDPEPEQRSTVESSFSVFSFVANENNTLII